MESEALSEALPVQNRPSEQTPEDPDLARIVAAWSNLPDHIKAAIMALIGTVPANPGEKKPTA